MEKEKTMPVVLIGLLIVIVLDLGFGLYEHYHISNRESYGNERWKQVEEILNDYDTRIKTLEERLNE